MKGYTSTAAPWRFGPVIVGVGEGNSASRVSATASDAARESVYGGLYGSRQGAKRGTTPGAPYSCEGNKAAEPPGLTGSYDRSSNCLLLVGVSATRAG